MKETREILETLLRTFGITDLESYVEGQEIVNEAEAALDALIAEKVAEGEKAKNAAYWERDQLVAALSKVFPAWIGYHDGEWEDDWRTIVYIKIPLTKPTVYGDARNSLGPRYRTEYKQISWHIHDNEKKYFEHLDPGLEEWDGHSTDEKYDRLRLLTPPAEQSKEAGALSAN